MLVMFHDGSNGASTGVTYTAPNFRESTVHFRRMSNWDDNAWYYSLVAHELAHAWHFKAIGGISAVWSGEGIANWLSEERLRLAAGLGLDANYRARSPIQGWPLRMPETGDFVAGYRESHPSSGSWCRAWCSTTASPMRRPPAGSFGAPPKGGTDATSPTGTSLAKGMAWWTA